MKTLLTKSLNNTFLATTNTAINTTNTYIFNKGYIIDESLKLISNNQILNQNSTSLFNLKSEASTILNYTLSSYSMIISKPIFTITNNKVIIQLFFYFTEESNNTNAIGIDPFKKLNIEKLLSLLSSLFNKETELRFIRLQYPFLNSYILAQYIAYNGTKYNFSKIQSMLLDKQKLGINYSTNVSNEQQLLTAYLTGIKIIISGRLMTQKMIPRSTVQTAQMGTFHYKTNSSNFIEYDKYTTKNKIGAITVKVWLSQVLPN